MKLAPLQNALMSHDLHQRRLALASSERVLVPLSGCVAGGLMPPPLGLGVQQAELLLHCSDLQQLCSTAG